jgi:hypothetical protein
MIARFPSEFLLTAACAMWPPSVRRTEAICAAATESIDWMRFLRVATRHRVLGLVHDGLKEIGREVPPDIAQELGRRAEALLRDSLAMAAEAIRLQRLFDDAGLPALFLKGASLAVLAYGNLGLRDAKDIDLLVSPETLPSAIALVTRAGYERFDPPPNISDAQLRLLMPLRRDLGFIHKGTGHQIELHWQLFLNPHALNESSVMTASRLVPLAENSMLRTLGAEDLFAYLCLHGALHTWNQLKWLADVGALLATVPQGKIEWLHQVAEAKGAGRAAGQAMLLCQQLLGMTVPPPLMEMLGRSAKVRWLQKTALKAMTVGRGEREPREVRFGTTWGTLSAFLLGRGWRYYLAELKNHLNNQTDILAVPLSERWRFLYPIIRLPLWVWRHSFRRDED